MEFKFVQSSTAEVNNSNIHVDLIKLQKYINENILTQSFGSSIDKFYFGHEIADSTGYLKHHTETKNLRRYGRRYLLIVKQFDYNELKTKNFKEQFEILKIKILEAIDDVSKMAKKPKDFNQNSFLTTMKNILTEFEVTHCN